MQERVAPGSPGLQLHTQLPLDLKPDFQCTVCPQRTLWRLLPEWPCACCQQSPFPLESKACTTLLGKERSQLVGPGSRIFGKSPPLPKYFHVSGTSQLKPAQASQSHSSEAGTTSISPRLCVSHVNKSSLSRASWSLVFWCVDSSVQGTLRCPIVLEKTSSVPTCFCSFFDSIMRVTPPKKSFEGTTVLPRSSPPESPSSDSQTWVCIETILGSNWTYTHITSWHVQEKSRFILH